MAQKLVGLDEIRSAQQRLQGTTVRTRLMELDLEKVRRMGFQVDPSTPRVFIKCENEQPIGSFKLRGAYNKIAALDADTLARGVITYSSGNHAQGVAYAARKLQTKAVIVMPNTSPRIKQEATRALGGEVVLVGPASNDRKQRAEELQQQYGYTIVPPYDDPFVIAGQATCATEILEDRPEIPLILAPVGGGGLLSGTSTAAKLLSHTTKVYGVEPELAADAQESFATHKVVAWDAARTTQTLADGLRTQSIGASNLEHLLQYTDGFLTVTEEEIRRATQIILQTTDAVAEPSGAVTLAGALFHWKELPPVSEIVVILSGGNLDPALKDELLAAKVGV